MLVKFKTDFFAPDGVLITKGVREYNGEEDKLPSSAVIVDRQGRLPVMSNTPKPDHGAKPLEEQVLDLIPGAGVTHQIDNSAAEREPALAAAAKVETATDPIADPFAAPVKTKK